ncbi:DUF1127 domain-containing protein [Frigidibacter albus]|uniref:DUF1127 domain-containing protein n=1 Tax=Frigidibacter albus TaxID=1465486 RepID=A0A6L8VEC0_9RHOB|nr:DUF1127 domain-containing protein [Frigidibacter albus]MZQ88514.1 DUF1127 domain-containing protein [Frigidibacter albus]NBE30677.1 DUF1127 domain-containing protein [Frigidibacter albus]GGH48800.1 hypothetical protein GCM10011341_10700 [Frigidibacter albus]
MFALFRSRLTLPQPGSLFRLLRRMSATRRQRRALLRLDDALLRDIGQDPLSARAEAARPIWDVPTHWRL